MIIAVIFALAGLATLNWFVRRSLLYPPAYFAFAWTGFLLLLALSGSMFYPISAPTLLFYFAGAFFFSVGGLCSTFLTDVSMKAEPAPLESFETTRAVRRVMLDGLLLSVIIAIPLYYRWLKQLVGVAEGSFLAAVRANLLFYSDTEAVRKFSLLDNFVAVSIPLTLLMFLENDGTLSRKLRVWIAAVAALTINVLSGGRAGAITLLLSLVALSWIVNRRLNWRLLAAAGVMFVLLFSFIAIALEKGTTRRDASLMENVPTIVEGFQWYAVGGIVGFDQVYHNPTIIPASWDLRKPFAGIANKLGQRVETKSLHAAYLMVGPRKPDNVYTMYFAYVPLLGSAGTLFLMTCLGFVLALIHRYAAARAPEALVLFAFCLAGLTLSGFNESILLAVNPLVKAFLLTALLYRWDALKRLIPRTQLAEAR
jgi:oligosaccharide repeat unit polymerase